jgi:hypothetical protein
MLLHRYCFLLFLAGLCPCPSQAQSLRSKKSKSVGRSGKGGSKGSSSSGKGGPKGGSSSGKGGGGGGGGVVIVGDSSGDGNGGPSPGSPYGPECGTTPPPSLTGGCDLACDFYKLAEQGAQAAIGEIPVVGSFFSTLLGVFWPSGTNDAEEILTSAINYIDGILAQYETTSVLDGIQNIYANLMDAVNSLNSRIQDGDSAGKRYVYLAAIFGQCNAFNNYIEIDALPPIEPLQNLTVDPIAVLAAIGNIGQVCLAMRTAEVYHYNSTIGGDQSAKDLITAKANLDGWVQNYTDFAKISTTNALTWRMLQIESSSSACSGGVNGK